MLAGKPVEPEVVKHISPETGARDTQKKERKPWFKGLWCVPVTASAEFVCAMEDTLVVCHRP